MPRTHRPSLLPDRDREEYDNSLLPNPPSRSLPRPPPSLTRSLPPSLSRRYRYRLAVDAKEYGISLDVSGTGMYAVPPEAGGGAAELAAADAALLDDNEAGGVLAANKGRADPTFNAAWLMRTTHMSNRAREVGFGQAEAIRRPRQAAAAAREEAIGGGGSASEQCDEIEAGFEAVRAFSVDAGLAHPDKPGVRAARVLPILPDLVRESDNYTYTLAKFPGEAPGRDTGLPWCEEDADNAVASAEAVMQFTRLGRLGKGEKIVAYMLPKQRPSGGEGEVAYAAVHEYRQAGNVVFDDESFCLWPGEHAVTYTSIQGLMGLVPARQNDWGDADAGAGSAQQRTYFVPRTIAKRRRLEANGAGGHPDD